MNFHIQRSGMNQLSTVANQPSEYQETRSSASFVHPMPGLDPFVAGQNVLVSLNSPEDDLYASAPLHPHGTNSGGRITGFPPGNGCFCSSFNTARVPTPAALDHNHTLIQVVSTIAQDTRDGCACICGLDIDQSLMAFGAMHDGTWPTHDQTGGRYPLELNIDHDANETALRLAEQTDVTRTRQLSYQCDTEAHRYREVRIGWDGRIPRWQRGSELSYVVCTESFPPPLARRMEDAMKRAISMWQGIGVSFKQVSRDAEATFAVRYQGGMCQKAYACSFFPGDSPAELLVFEPSCSQLEYLPNILAHEIGHILGLRHEFAHDRERENRSVGMGSEDARSIMNYFSHLEHLQVSKLDLEGLREFYAYDHAVFEGLEILDVEPEVHDFGEGRTSCPETKGLSRRFSC